MMSFSTYQAFNLLELLLCLCILGILLSLTYPSFEKAIDKAHRFEAKANLLKAADRLEKYYVKHQTYLGAQLSAMGIPEWVGQGKYHLELSTESESYEFLLREQGKERPLYRLGPAGLEVDNKP